MARISYFKKEPFNIAFIGGGINSAVGYAHFVSTRLDGFFNLVAGCFSKNEQINFATGEKYSIERSRIYKSWIDLLNCEKGNVDAIVVLTPIPNHLEIVSKAISLGFPVICEKSLTTSLQKTKLLKDIIRENNGHLFLTYNYSGYPMVRELKSQISLGKLGELHQIMIEMPQENFIKSPFKKEELKVQKWREIDYEISTISLDLGTHLHHLINFITNGSKPLSVVANLCHNGKISKVIDNANALIKYENNILVNGWYSKVALGHRNGLKIRVFGSKGSAEWYQMNPEILNLTDKYGNLMQLDRSTSSTIEATKERYQRFKPGHPGGFIEAYANIYMDIYNALSSLHKNEQKIDKPNFPLIGIDQEIISMKLMESIEISSINSNWVPLISK